MVFKSLFDRKPKEEEPKTGPLGLSVGRAVDIDFATLRVAADDLAIEPPQSDTFLISGYGVADLGGGSVVHRYYDDDNMMLQFLCEHGMSDSAIREITLFCPWHSLVPSNESEWERWIGPKGQIGAPDFVANGLTFDRLWDAQSEGHVSPIAFTETVLTDEEDYKIYQQIMLYSREAGFVREYLIIGAERLTGAGADDGSVEFLTGYDLGKADLNVV